MWTSVRSDGGCSVAGLEGAVDAVFAGVVEEAGTGALVFVAAPNTSGAGGVVLADASSIGVVGEEVASAGDDVATCAKAGLMTTNATINATRLKTPRLANLTDEVFIFTF